MNKTSDDEGGLFYALPMSIISVEIPIIKMVREKGDCFWDEALKERLGAKGATDIQSEWGTNKNVSTTYQIKEEEIKITTRAAPDPKKVFKIQLSGQWNKNRQLTASLNELGQMSQGEMINEDRTFDLVVQGVQSVASIISTLILPKSSGGTIEANLTDSANDDLTSPAKRKADLIAVRAARTKLLQSDDNVGAEGILKRKLEELDRIEADLISHLTYDETKTQIIIRADILLGAEETFHNKKISLLSFKKNQVPSLHVKPLAGTYENDYLRSFVNFLEEPAEDVEKVYTLNLSYVKGNQLSDFVSTPPVDSKVKRGLAYNIPVWARATIDVGPKADTSSPRKLVAVATIVVPQWGKLAYLPEKTSSTGFELDPFSGALRKLTVKQTGMTTEQVASAGTALNTAAGLFQNKSALDKTTGDNDLMEQKIRTLKLKMQFDSLNSSKDKLLTTESN